jgi:hypothetical protein
MKLFKMLTMVLIILILTSCTTGKYALNSLEAALKGRVATISTYDENSQIIDRIEGKSISVASDDKFKITDKEGNTIAKSGVLSVTVGGKTMIHVGSSLIIADKELPDVFNEFSKKVDIKNFNRSIPIINRLVNDMKNYTVGQKLLILVRSQNGTPVASFVGNEVGYFATDIDKSTALVVDGKSLFIYRCDYTIYDLALFQ